MKTRIYILLIFVFNMVLNRASSQVIGKKALYIESANFGTLTSIAITCQEFEVSFAGRIAATEVESVDTIKMLDSFLQSVRYSKKSDDIDVRAKIIYDKGNGERVRICISKFDIMIDGRLVKYNNKFYNFLRGLTR
jgi:hypothetical protein